MNQTDIPDNFRTNNAALVAAAKILGIPWVQKVPCIIHHYTRPLLKKLGFDTMEEAMAARRRGNPEYILAKTPELTRFLKAWDAAKELILKDGEKAKLTLKNCTIEEAATLLAFFSDKKKEILDLVWEVPGTMTEEHSGSARTKKLANGKTRIQAPGFKQYTSNLNAADRARLKV